MLSFYGKITQEFFFFNFFSPGARSVSENRECVKKSSFQSQTDSIRSDDESEYTYDDEEEEEEEDEVDKNKIESSYEAQAEKILENPQTSKDVSPDLVILLGYLYSFSMYQQAFIFIFIVKTSY